MPKTRRIRRTAEHNSERETTARPLWSGTISFGLVSIPVNLFPANRDSRVSLRMLGPDNRPLKREFAAPETGEELETTEMTRGFETAKGQYVTVTEEELERLAPEKSRDIDLRVFVRRDEISPLYFERAYFLTPADQTAKAYRLLAETMQRKERVGVATFVMRGKEYLVAILSDNGILRAEILRFVEEVRTPSDIKLPKRRTASAAGVRKFKSAIAKLTKKNIDAAEMGDKHAEDMLKLIEKKKAAHKDLVETAAEPKPKKVVDLMEVLKQSLGRNKQSRRRAA